MGPQHLSPMQLLCLLGAISSLPCMSCGAGCFWTLLAGEDGGAWIPVAGGGKAAVSGSLGDKIYGG